MKYKQLYSFHFIEFYIDKNTVLNQLMYGNDLIFSFLSNKWEIFWHLNKSLILAYLNRKNKDRYGIRNIRLEYDEVYNVIVVTQLDLGYTFDILLYNKLNPKYKKYIKEI